MRGKILVPIALAAPLVAGGCTSEPAATPVNETPASTSTPLPPEGYGLLQPGTYTLHKTTVPAENSACFDSLRIAFTVPRGWEAWDLGSSAMSPTWLNRTTSG